jgi:DNA-binding SARP family transcriptional activator
MKPQLLLCWLAMNSKTSMSVEALIAALWDDGPPSAKAKVHTYVSEVRKALRRASRMGPPGWPILNSQGGYRLCEDVDVDSRQFESNAREARQVDRLGDHARASDLFVRALDMWRGPAVADMTSYTIQAAAAALNEQRLLAIEGKAEADIHLGRYDDVVAELSSVSAANPLRERLRGILMLALYRRGARSEALAVYGKGHQVVSAELGLPPSLPLRRLQNLIFHDDPALWIQSPNCLLSTGSETDGARRVRIPEKSDRIGQKGVSGS